jgi:hypothetical protein
VGCRKSDMEKLKQAFEKRDNEFADMVNIQSKKEKV